eukprot:TRINITY_DN2292_c2_g2_i1.p1 TRINITY_DN2292_c2_g2~~TRINITY_DN2292_c2_g2_i1.p1  ORF type:complete len:535 (+),score=135.33 TRINITY_DN2292_c2_g2_i1:78-1682(+)
MMEAESDHGPQCNEAAAHHQCRLVRSDSSSSSEGEGWLLGIEDGALEADAAAADRARLAESYAKRRAERTWGFAKAAKYDLARGAHFISTVRGPIYFKQKAGHQQGQAWDCSLLLVKHLEAMLSDDVGQTSSSAQAHNALEAVEAAQAVSNGQLEAMLSADAGCKGSGDQGPMLSADAGQKSSSAQGLMLSADAGRQDSSSAQGDDAMEAAAAAAAAAAMQGHVDAVPSSGARPAAQNGSSAQAQLSTDAGPAAQEGSSAPADDTPEATATATSQCHSTASAAPGGSSAQACDERQAAAAAEAASNGRSAAMGRLSMEEAAAARRCIPTLSEMSVLELGCAVGLPGVAAAVLGACAAVLTDLPDGAAAARETLLLNKEALGAGDGGWVGSACSSVLRWGNASDVQHVSEIMRSRRRPCATEGCCNPSARATGANPNVRAQGWPPDLVLMSDLLYGDVTAAAALVETLRQVCGPETQVGWRIWILFQKQACWLKVGVRGRVTPVRHPTLHRTSGRVPLHACTLSSVGVRMQRLPS